jgi:prepilin-type N-terminal cleavage/methylation domain-containing protein
LLQAILLQHRVRIAPLIPAITFEHAMLAIPSSNTRASSQRAAKVRVGRCVRAFSMIELTIVILITGILAAVTAPAYLDSLLFHRVETAARRVKADIEYARQRARLTSTAQTVTFAGSTYTLSGAKSLTNPTKVYTVNLQKSPYSLNSATANFAGSQTISFDGYGTPSAGGTVVLSAKGHQCTVAVEPVNGTATISSNHAAGGSSQVSGS